MARLTTVLILGVAALAILAFSRYPRDAELHHNQRAILEAQTRLDGIALATGGDSQKSLKSNPLVEEFGRVTIQRQRLVQDQVKLLRADHPIREQVQIVLSIA